MVSIASPGSNSFWFSGHNLGWPFAHGCWKLLHMFFYCIHFNKSIYVTLKRPYNKHKTSDVRSNIDFFLVRWALQGNFKPRLSLMYWLNWTTARLIHQGLGRRWFPCHERTGRGFLYWKCRYINNLSYSAYSRISSTPNIWSMTAIASRAGSFIAVAILITTPSSSSSSSWSSEKCAEKHLETEVI